MTPSDMTPTPGPNRETHIVIGSRGSKLAVVQAVLAAERLRAISPQTVLDFKTIRTEGDRDRTRSLDEIGGQGIFVKELERALLAGDIDLAVHSLKDVPTELEPGLKLAAVLPREDPRDVLVTGSGLGLAALPSGARIGTDSRRRAAQLLAARKDLAPCPIRGNIDTRLRKVQSGEFEGAIIAAAALLRLGWADRITEYLPASFLPAVGQGAIVIEMREGDRESQTPALPGLEALLAAANDPATWRCVLAERAFLRALGGGCRAPIAALGAIREGRLFLEGMLGSTPPAGEEGLVRDAIAGPPEMGEALGTALAQRILARVQKDAVAAGRPDVSGG